VIFIGILSIQKPLLTSVDEQGNNRNAISGNRFGGQITSAVGNNANRQFTPR